MSVILYSLMYILIHSMSYNLHFTILHIFNFELDSDLGKYWFQGNSAILQCVKEIGCGPEKEEALMISLLHFLGASLLEKQKMIGECSFEKKNTQYWVV